MSSESLAKDELISTKNMIKTDVSKNSVHSKLFNDVNLHLIIKVIQVLISIGSGLKTPQESYVDKSILANLWTLSRNEEVIIMISETKIDNSFSNISIKYDSLLNYFQIWLGKSLGWNFCICNGRYSFLVKQLKLTAMVILTGMLWRFI